MIPAGIIASSQAVSWPDFPELVATSTSVSDTSIASHSLTLPEGIAKGDMILVTAAFNTGTAPFTPIPGYTTAAVTNTAGQQGIYAATKMSDGTDSGATVTFSASGSCSHAMSAHVYRYANIGVLSWGAAASISISATVDPPSVNPTAADQDCTVIVIASIEGTTGTYTSEPTGFTFDDDLHSGSATSLRLSYGVAELTGDSFDPSAWVLTDTSGPRCAATIAIPSGKPPALTGSPQVVAHYGGQESSATTTHTVALGSVDEGDLLVLAFAPDGGVSGSASLSGTGWTNTGAAGRLCVYGKVADGTEGFETYTWTNGSESARSAQQAFVIKGATADIAEVYGQGGGAGPDNGWNPSTFTPTGGSQEYLWMVIYSRGDASIPPPGYPAGFDWSSQKDAANQVANHVGWKVATAASDDPEPGFSGYGLGYGGGLQLAVSPGGA